MKRALNDSTVRSTKPKDKRQELRDGGGLALWVYPSGARSWVYTYSLKEENGATRKVRWAFGEYPTVPLVEARRRHDLAREKVRNGIDPKAEHERAIQEEAAKRALEAAEMTVEVLCERYISLHAKPKKKSWAVDQRQIAADILPRWGKRKARSIERADAQSLLDTIVARGAPVAANRMKALLSRIFNWAMSREYVDENPIDGIETPYDENPRERYLTEEEVRPFWMGLDETLMSKPIKSALRLILTTCQRPGEVANMRFEEVIEHEGLIVWSIPGERRKNGKPHIVPLSAQALEIIGERKGRTGYVFADATGKAVTVLALGRAVRNTFVAEPREDPPQKHGKIRRHQIRFKPFTPHDLRRTGTTLMRDVGVMKPHILGHSPKDITRQVYDLYSYLDEKARALEAWGRKLKSLVTCEEHGKVIQLRTSR